MPLDLKQGHGWLTQSVDLIFVHSEYFEDNIAVEQGRCETQELQYVG